MRKVGLFVLFLKSVALNFFLAVPAIAEDFTKKNANIVLAQAVPQYYVVPIYPAAYYPPASNATYSPKNSRAGYENRDVNYDDREKFPEASTNYQPKGEYYWY